LTEPQVVLEEDPNLLHCWPFGNFTLQPARMTISISNDQASPTGGQNLDLSLQKLWPYILAAFPVVIALLSGIYHIVSKYREGPRVDVSVKSCRHGGSTPDHLAMRLTIRNRGTRPTSIESLKLKAKSDGRSFDGVLLTLQDQSELRKVGVSYRVETPPEPERYLPLRLDSDQTVFLLAVFAMNGILSAPTAKCVLEMVCTHKTIKSTCESSLSRVLF
jgi:hypothetical protein